MVVTCLKYFCWLNLFPNFFLLPFMPSPHSFWHTSSLPNLHSNDLTKTLNQIIKNEASFQKMPKEEERSGERRATAKQTKKFISSQTKLIWPQPMSKQKIKYLLEHI
ncbi:unnamed protein product [Meloidogyne enterolobii]|uniref:Uncharacterized protein n=1 Tax=Meloidogyne enterolobii TaxID=390850 RepID=A0ACB1APE5_MELEN